MRYLCVAMLLVACDDENNKLGIGSTCEEDAQCESGLCYELKCLDPAVDSDEDGLVNSIEAGLGMDPFSGDTDGDGLTDKEEIGNSISAPTDSDGDGRIDARESIQADCDQDELTDQSDDDDGLDAKGQCTNVQSPCPRLCAVATGLQCPTEDACLPTCESTFTSFDLDCKRKFDAIVTCIQATSGVSCPEGTDAPWEIVIPDGSCVSETVAINPCLGTTP